jgi:hypothetical protein
MSKRFLCAVTGALLVWSLTSAPASAAPLYTSTTVAGVRADNIVEWINSNTVVIHDPEAVEATWPIPCLPSGYTDAAGRIQGSYDQWIGLETADGANYVKVGIRSYHLDLGWFQTTGYFAWYVNTASPTGRSVVQLPNHINCGTTITARVIRDGRYCIQPESVGYCWTVGNLPLAGDTRYPLPSLGTAAFMIERFTGGTTHMPYFGRAEFHDAKVLYVNNGHSSGSYAGAPDVTIRESIQMRNSYTTDNVSLSGTSPYGAFNLYQFQPPPISYPGGL